MRLHALRAGRGIGLLLAKSFRMVGRVSGLVFLFAACSQPLQEAPRVGSDFNTAYNCGQFSQTCCAGELGAACMPGLSCQSGICAAGAADAGVSEVACGTLHQSCCALADGSHRCRDTSLSCDGATLTCVPATADELGGDQFGSRPTRGQQCVREPGMIWNTYGICTVTSPSGICAGSNLPGIDGCAGTQVKCCPAVDARDWVPGDDVDGPTVHEGEETAQCRDARADANARLDLACRYDAGEACGGGRTCVDTTRVNETDCRSMRCGGGSSMMCCKTTTSTSNTGSGSGSGAGYADGGSTPTDVNRRDEGDSCDFTGDGQISSADNAICTADTSGRDCVSLRCLNAGHAVRCCRPRSGGTSTGGSTVPSGVGASCNQRQSDGSFKMGVCVQVDGSGESSQCFSTPESGLCPGPSEVRCCLD